MGIMVEKIIQFGEGNFLRGFVDWFIDNINEKGLFDGKVVVVQPIKNGLCDVLNEQDGKYNLYLRGIKDGKETCEHTYIKSISRAVNPYDDFDGYLALAHNKDFRFIVSNTTEAGIAYDESCLFSDKPQSSFPGKLTRLLFERYKAGLDGFIILSCELIDNNGKELLNCVNKYIDLWNLGSEFKEWVNTQNSFCSTLVDRIVTGYPKDEAEDICKSLGYTDKLLDTAEIFHLWVIEGEHEDELPLKKAGFNVVWTDDVSPYKKRKVRILNGAHTSMVLGAILSGLTTVLDCMNDETVSAYLSTCLFKEIVPTLNQTDDTFEFANAVLERFKNPYIKHQLRSIALNSVSKFAVRVLPSISEYKKLNGIYPKCLTMSLAFLISFYKNDNPNDIPEVMSFMKSASPKEILANTDLWGTDISDMEDEINKDLAVIDEIGAKEAMKWILLK